MILKILRKKRDVQRGRRSREDAAGKSQIVSKVLKEYLDRKAGTVETRRGQLTQILYHILLQLRGAWFVMSGSELVFATWH